MSHFRRPICTATLLPIFFAAVLPSVGYAAEAAARLPVIIPQPDKYEAGDGAFTVSRQTVLITDTASKPIAEYMANLLAPAIGAKPAIVEESNGNSEKKTDGNESIITFQVSSERKELEQEGYHLKITPGQVEIVGPAPAGVFYACQTLRQLLPAEIEAHRKLDPALLTLPACTIDDQPRYSWRGLHLDVSRHFFTKAEVMRYIDLFAFYKMNVFHWHLTDDQGWRIEIKKYPRLTEVGAWRPAEVADTDPAKIKQSSDGSILYGGFYTQDDIREVVAFAHARYVTVVPEIEMPGHSTAALAAYPEFSCTGGPFKTGVLWGVFKDVYCPGKEETFTFIDNVLTEVCGLFPDSYIHVGGDECPKERWKKCPDCQKRMQENGLNNEEELQSYFIKRVEKMLEAKHHRLIGWDEILQGGLAPDATVTSWRGMSGGHTAATQGHDVIMCPESNCYFDHTEDIGSRPKGAGSFLFVSPVPLNKVYAFEPTPTDLTPEQGKHILGAQGNLWSERIPTQDRLDYMAYPRAIALAECLWTHRGEYPEFAARLVQQFKRLDLMGVKYNNDPLAYATLIGQWQPSDNLPKQPTDVDYAITPYLREPGNYAVRFEFLEGKDRIDINSVALLENGVELMRDAHPAFAGSSAQANLFLLNAAEIKPDATYTARASISARKAPIRKDRFFCCAHPVTLSP